jgi:hypothetical protein
MAPQERPLCVRCPPLLENKQRSSVTGLCRDCSTYYCLIKRKTNRPNLSVPEFIESYPSRYLLNARLCQRCPSTLKRTAGRLGLCESCCSNFYTWRAVYRAEHLGKADLTVALYIEQHPRRKREKIPCLRCPSELGRVAVQLGLCNSCAKSFYGWRKNYQIKHPKELDPTVKQFVTQCPSRYGKIKTLCLRCPAEFGSVASSRDLCRSCSVGFYRWRKIYRAKHPEEPDPTVAQFIAQCPSRYVRTSVEQRVH